MVRVEFEDSSRLHAHLGVQALEVFLHLERHAFFRHHANRMRTEVFRKAHFLHIVAKRRLHKLQRCLRLFGLLGSFLLFFVGRKAEVLLRDRAEVLFRVLSERLRYEAVDLVGHEQHVEALLPQLLKLRQLRKSLPVFAACKVDILLLLGHGVHVFLEGDELVLLVGPVEKQVLQELFFRAVIVQHAVLDLHAKRRIELLVFLAILLHELCELGFDLLLEISGNKLELAVVLEHFTRNVEAQILRVNNAADKAEAVRQQLFAVFHDHHTGGVQLQALLEVLRVEIIRRSGRDIEQRLVRHRALDAYMDRRNRVFKVEELFLVEVVVLLGRDVLLCPLPERHHRVERLVFGVRLILGLVRVFGFLLHPRLFHLELDRVADVVGVFLDQLLKLPRL